MNKDLMRKMGFEKELKRIDEGKCPLCGKKSWDQDERMCEHCKMPIRIRNPSGYCDHLYYPENCRVCRENLSRKEFEISGMCQMCQDKVFR